MSYLDKVSVGGTTYDVQDTAAQEALATKAEVDGYYDELTAGTAEQLIATSTIADNAPYAFRTSGGSADIGNRATEKVVGGSVVWNQLVASIATSVTVQSGHKYVASVSGTWSAGTGGSALSVTGGTDMIFDLTQMFGATVADAVYAMETATPGAGVAWFRGLFPKAYYAYNAGTLMNVDTNAHVTRGFNAWDEEWELGGLNDDGTKDSTTNKIRSKNFIRVIPGAAHYCYFGSNASIGGRYYDSAGNYIGSAVSIGNQTFTPPTNAVYMLFACSTGYGTTYNNNICINLSWSGYRNGEYAAYSKHTYPLEAMELRGIPKWGTDGLYYDGDTYESDGTVTRRYGVVTITSDMVGTYNTGGTIPRVTVTLTVLPKQNTYNLFPTNGYLPCAAAPSTSGWIRAVSIGFHMWDAAWESLEDAQTALNGVTVVYELDTPTTASAAPYQNPQIVDDWGTEEYVDALATAATSPRDVSIPVGHETQYMANLRDKLQHLPNLAGSAKGGNLANGVYAIQQTGTAMSLVAGVTASELAAETSARETDAADIYMEPWQLMMKKWFITEGPTGVVVHRNHIKYTPASSATVSILRTLVGTYRSTNTRLGDFTPLVTELIPVSVFGSKIKMEFFLDVTDGVTRLPRFCYKFCTVSGDVVTNVSYGTVTETAVAGQICEATVDVPENATHVFFGMLFSSGFNVGTYDMVYKVDKGE